MTGAAPSLTFRIDLTDDASAAVGAIPDVFMDELAKAAVEVGNLLQREIVERTPTSGAGTLRQSIQLQPLEISATRITAIVGTSLPYALPVETGSKPHMPPEQAIREWVIRKGLVSRPRTAGGRVSKAKASVRNYEDQVDAITAAIRWKIFRKGTPAVRMFERGVAENLAGIQAIVDEAARTALRRAGVA